MLPLSSQASKENFLDSGYIGKCMSNHRFYNGKIIVIHINQFLLD